MTLEELLTEIGEEKAAVVKEAIQAQKNRSIVEAKKKSLGIALDALRASLTEAGIDPAEDIQAQLDEMRKPPKGGKTDENAELTKAELKKVQRELADLKTAFTTEQTAKTEALAKLNRAKLTEALSKQIDGRMHAQDMFIENMILTGKVKIGDDEQPVFVQGDTEIDLKTGVDKWMKENPKLVINQTKPGSGKPVVGHQQQSGNDTEMSTIEMLRMGH